jgi:hypothetical protein
MKLEINDHRKTKIKHTILASLQLLQTFNYVIDNVLLIGAKILCSSALDIMLYMFLKNRSNIRYL